MSDRNAYGLAVNSRVFFHLAAEACDEARGGLGARSLVGIVFSAIAIESFVNEILERVGTSTLDEDAHEDSRVSTLRTMSAACDLFSKSCSLETRIQVIYAALEGRAIDKGAQPYQDFDLLVALRNAIVHDRPERTFADEQGKRASGPQSIVTRLVARRVIMKPDESGTIVPALNSLLQPSVSTFAFDAALTMARMLAAQFPDFWSRKLLFGFERLDNTVGERTVFGSRGTQKTNVFSGMLAISAIGR